MKKLVNLIALVMLVSTNVFTPFSYAQVDTPEVIPENEIKNVVETGETPEYIEEFPENTQDNLGELEQENQDDVAPEDVLPNIQNGVETPATDETEEEDTENNEVIQSVGEYTSNEKQEKDLEDNNGTTEKENVKAKNQELQKNQEISTMDTTTNSKNIVLQATATEAGQTLKINKYFANAYMIDWGDGTTGNLTSDTPHTYSTAGTYSIILSTTANRWRFQYGYKPLVPQDGTTMTGVKITYMPSLEEGFGASATAPGHYFFNSFNSYGALTSLPEGSFDISKITTVGNNFFHEFNKFGLLTSLPEGSFDTSKITTVRSFFFSDFNFKGALTSLPEGSFKFSSGLTIVEDAFFLEFNEFGSLTSLPEGSFDTSKITTVGDYFFDNFNKFGLLTGLPEGSFDTSEIMTVGDYFFECFNEDGALTSLPERAFRLSTGLATVGNYFFSAFNYSGQLTSLPEGSFDTSKITTVGSGFFSAFNYSGQLTSLPEGSFDTSKITTVGNYFFYNFNSYGTLTSLPGGSFRLSTGLTIVGDFFFNRFNLNGALTSLPEGSFDTSKITTIGYSFFGYFNYNGALTSLPELFKLNSVAYNKSSAYSYAFNSTGYTFNRRVSDIVSGVIALIYDRNTFSDNQLGRCGVDPNWLDNPSKACKIIYEANGGIGTVTGGYMSNAINVEPGSGIKLPIMEGHVISGWVDASGNNVDQIIFPDMDGQTLYANWEECENGYIANHSGTACVLKEYSIVHDLKGGYYEDDGKIYEGNQVITYTYNPEEDSYYNLNPKIIKRDNSKFIGWYTAEGDEFDFGKIPEASDVVYAKYVCDLGYTENAEKTSCEKIRVEFNANGGKFSDNSDVYSIIKSKQVYGEKPGVLHAANLDDDGNYINEFNGQQMNGYTTSIAQYTSGGITTYLIYSPSIVYFEEENVEKLNVSIKYGGSPYCIPGYIILWTGDRRQFDVNYNSGNTGLAVLYIGDFPNFGENSEKSVEIEGNSFTIYQNGGCPSYGFFANISGTRVDLTYEENAFDDIPYPIRNGYKFIGWYYNEEGLEKKFNSKDIMLDRIYNVYAKWEKLGSSGGGGGGGGGGGATKPDTPKEEQKPAESPQSDVSTGTTVKEPESSTGNKAEIQTGSQVDSPEAIPQNDDSVSSGANAKDPENTTPMDSSILSQNDEKTYSTEFQQAYKFAHENGITTKDTIQSAQMNGKLTRIAMAKMLSQYAINVLGKEPDVSKGVVKFNDVTLKKDADYDNGVTLAYQLGIMGQNMPGNKFRPNDEVTRAEFATALSRMAYGTSDGEYEATSKYYIHHMEKLVKEGIITKDDPNMKELRGYVMIMLMRSAEG